MSGAGAGDALLPFVTVVMPVRNEEHSIARSLGAVLDQDYPPSCYDVIIADGMSADATRAVVADVAARRRARGPAPDVTVLDNLRRAVPAGLNEAVARSRADVIIRIDGHCEITSDYVTRCVRLLADTGADNVGGIAVAEGRGLVGRAVAVATSSPFGAGNASWRYATAPRWTHTVPFGCWWRETIERLGGFDEELVRNQDDEFNLRLCQAGGRIWLDPSIRTAYECRSDLRGLWRQYFGYGLYKVRVMQKRGGYSSLTHLVPGGFVAGLSLSVLSGVLTGRRRVAAGVAVPYTLAVIAATASGARRDLRSTVMLPVVYPVVHCAYGVGTLAGLWRWRRGFRQYDGRLTPHVTRPL